MLIREYCTHDGKEPWQISSETSLARQVSLVSLISSYQEFVVKIHPISSFWKFVVVIASSTIYIRPRFGNVGALGTMSSTQGRP